MRTPGLPFLSVMPSWLRGSGLNLTSEKRSHSLDRYRVPELSVVGWETEKGARIIIFLIDKEGICVRN